MRILRVVSPQPARDRCRHATAADLEVGHVERAVAARRRFIGDGALATHGGEVVVGVDKGEALRRRIFQRRTCGFAIGIANEHNLDVIAAVPSHLVLLHPRRGHGHVNPPACTPSLLAASATPWA